MVPDGATGFNATSAAIRRIMSIAGVNTLVQVKAVHSVGLEPVGTVDVQIMVHQQDGAGRTVPHGVIYGLPYFRLQGGTKAVICDPSVGDIGAAIVCGRDISSVKANRAPSAPGSFRQYDYADGLYLGGFLNGIPEEYIWLTGDGVKVQTKGEFTVSASKVTFDCDIMTTGDVKAAGISLNSHEHSGVQKGSEMSGGPQ